MGIRINKRSFGGGGAFSGRSGASGNFFQSELEQCRERERQLREENERLTTQLRECSIRLRKCIIEGVPILNTDVLGIIDSMLPQL